MWVCCMSYSLGSRRQRVLCPIFYTHRPNHYCYRCRSDCLSLKQSLKQQINSPGAIVMLRKRGRLVKRWGSLYTATPVCSTAMSRDWCWVSNESVILALPVALHTNIQQISTSRESTESLVNVEWDAAVACNISVQHSFKKWFSDDDDDDDDEW